VTGKDFCGLRGVLKLAGVFSSILFCATTALSQGTLQVGYAVVSPAFPAAGVMVAFEDVTPSSPNTFEAGPLPETLTRNALVRINVSSSADSNLGIVILNPSNSIASVGLVLRQTNGTQVAAATIQVISRQQISKFITELLTVPPEFSGTMVLTSTTPVSLYVLKVRGSAFAFLPVSDLDSNPNNFVPAISTGVGGLGSILLPQFVTGAGWKTEIQIHNTTSFSQTVRLDAFRPDGSPLPITINGTTLSTFTNLVIPASGVLRLTP